MASCNLQPLLDNYQPHYFVHLINHIALLPLHKYHNIFHLLSLYLQSKWLLEHGLIKVLDKIFLYHVGCMYTVGIFERSPKSRDRRSCGNGTYDLSRKYGSTGRHVSATVWGSEAHDGIKGALS